MKRWKYNTDDDMDDYLRNALSIRKSLSLNRYDELEDWLTHRDPADEEVENPLQYQINNRIRWPHLAQMVMDVFSVPAMSSGAEREFSKVRRILEDNRIRLRFKVVDALMCLRFWDEEGVIHIVQSWQSIQFNQRWTLFSVDNQFHCIFRIFLATQFHRGPGGLS